MPAPEYVAKVHRAVLWPLSGYGEDGEPTVGTPEDVRVAWKYGRSDALAPDGTRIAVDATVAIDQDVAIGSSMWKAPSNLYSAVEQWSGTGSGGEDDEVMDVVTFNWAQDVKGRCTSRTVGLKKRMDVPPSGG